MKTAPGDVESSDGIAPVGPEPVPARSWCASARADPITRLVAFPDFHAQLPALMWAALRQGRSVGVAIGDVDGLKGYVEASNRTDSHLFGHMAGCAYMGRLGAIAGEWFAELEATEGCLSSFGGDEIIVVLADPGVEEFFGHITDLRDRLCARLPRSVSFAGAVVELPDVRVEQGGHGVYLETIQGIDRTLLEHKAALRDVGQSLDGFVVRWERSSSES